MNEMIGRLEREVEMVNNISGLKVKTLLDGIEALKKGADSKAQGTVVERIKKLERTLKLKYVEKNKIYSLGSMVSVERFAGVWLPMRVIDFDVVIDSKDLPEILYACRGGVDCLYFAKEEQMKREE